MQLPLLPLLAVLAVAWVAGKASERVGYPSVLGELLAGILVGPPILGLLQSDPALNVIAELGIILMMFYVGMEIDPAELRKASVGGVLASIGGFATPFVLCYLLVVGFGGTSIEGMFVGMAAGVTSLATKSRILVDLHLLNTRIAHVMMAGALLADTLSLIIFAAIIGVADPGEAGGAGNVFWVIAKIVLFFGGAWAVGRFLFPRVGALLQRLGSEVSFTALLLVTLVFAEAAHASGLHAVLGAFLAGLFLREKTIGRTLTNDTITWVRRAALGFLAPVFFVTAGFEMDLSVIWNRPGLVASVIGVATVGKIVGTALFYLPTGNGWREGVVIGAGMNGRGAVEIIVAQIGLSMGIIDTDTFSVLVLMAILTTALVPLFLKWGSAWLRGRNQLVRSREGRSGTVIVGAGPVNRILGSLLADRMPVTVVDTSLDNCEASREDGLNAVHGSALDDLVLSRAGAGEATYVLAHSGNREVDALAARQGRTLFSVPNVHIVHDGRNTAAHDEALAHTQGETAFGAPVRLEEWDFMAGRGQTALVPYQVGASETVADFLSHWGQGDQILPLCLRRGDEIIPTFSKMEIEPGDTLMLLEAGAASKRDQQLAQLVDEAPTLDLDGPATIDDVKHAIAEILGKRLGVAVAEIEERFAEPDLWLATIVSRGVAIPHIRLEEGADIEMVLVRASNGITISDDEEPLTACFVLATPDARRSEHLRVLAEIVRVIGRPSFMDDWLKARGAAGLREVMTRHEVEPEGQQ